MKQFLNKISILVVMLAALVLQAEAQCAICTKTAMQMGEGPAKGLNAAILYLMAIPLTILFFIGYRWYRRENAIRKKEQHP